MTESLLNRALAVCIRIVSTFFFLFFFERCESPLLEGVDTKGAGHSLSALKALTHHGPEVGDTQVSNF